MRFLVLVPWKPVVLVWALLTGMILVGFTASSLLQGKDHPLAPGAVAARSTGTKSGAAHSGQQAKPSHKSPQGQ
jgi:hypothetical protein